jgi:hypothetical protein
MTKAAEHYDVAARAGHLQAQVNLGVLFVIGDGQLQDMEKAYMWFNIAASKGHNMARKYRDRIAAKMSRREILLAQKKAQTCYVSDLKDCS